MSEEYNNKNNLIKLEKLLQKIARDKKEGNGIAHFNDSILDAYNEKILSKDEMNLILLTANQGNKK